MSTPKKSYDLLEHPEFFIGLAIAMALMCAVALGFVPRVAAEEQTIANVTVHVTSAGCSPVYVTLPIVQLVDPITYQVTILYPSLFLDENGTAVGARGVTSNSTHVSFWIKVNATSPTTLRYYAVYGTSILQEDRTNAYYGEIPIQVNNSGSALSDYTVNVPLDLSALVAAGVVKTNLNDIRFRDSNGNMLAYWFADSDPASAVDAYVRMGTVPAGTSYIYLMYFNPMATDGRDGEGTFLLWDDFAGSSLNSTKWSLSSYGEITVSNGEVTATGLYAGITSTTTLQADVQVVARAKLNSGGPLQIWWREHWSYEASNGMVLELSTSAVAIAKYVSSSRTVLNSTSISYSTGTYAKLVGFSVENSHAAIATGYGSTTASDSSVASGGTVKFRVGATSGTIVCDYIFARKYTLSDPTCALSETFAATVEVSGITQPTGSVITNTTVQVIVPWNVSAQINSTWPGPGMDASDAVEFVAQYGVGRYLLVVLPILVILAAGAAHTGGVVAATVAGLCAYTNYALGYDLYSTTLLGWIAAMGVLLFVLEQKGRR